MPVGPYLVPGTLSARYQVLGRPTPMYVGLDTNFSGAGGDQLPVDTDFSGVGLPLRTVVPGTWYHVHRRMRSQQVDL